MFDLENLKQLRQEKGLSQMKVAKAVGVSVNTIVKWENGVGKPTPENLLKLEKVFE